MPASQRTKCPNCKSEDLRHGRSAWRVVLGIVFIIVGVVFALPTLGITMPLLLLGIFMVAKRSVCQQCGWQDRYRPK